MVIAINAIFGASYGIATAIIDGCALGPTWVACTVGYVAGAIIAGLAYLQKEGEA